MKKLIVLILLALTTSAQAAPWSEAIRVTKHPVARHYLIASYWSWREYKRWNSPTNLRWALTELEVAITVTQQFSRQDPALRLMEQIRKEIAR